MERRNWMQVSRTLVEKYKIHSLNNSLKNLPLQIFLTAASTFSGPIALLVDKSINHRFILPQIFTNNIVILNCKGQIKKTIPYNVKDKVIFMGFTKTQQLLLIEASGNYFLLDPFSGQLFQGNYSQASYTSTQKPQRYRGCELMPNNYLIMLRQKQLGFVESPTSKWQPLLDTKIKVQNPIFSCVFNSQTQFTYLTRSNNIQLINIETNEKSIIYNDSFLNSNCQNLLAMSYNKYNNCLGLVFYKPSLIYYIDLSTGNHKRLDAMFQLKYGLESSNTPGLTLNYNTRNVYKTKCYTLSWMVQKCTMEQDLQEFTASILVFGNPKLLLMYDGQTTKLSTRLNCNQIISTQLDCIRIYAQQYLEIYRIVPELYQTVIQINTINKNDYVDRFGKIIQLHDQYTNYLQKQITDLTKLDSVFQIDHTKNIENHDQQNQICQKLIKNVEEYSKKQCNANKQNMVEIKQNVVEKKNKIQQIQNHIIKPLIKSLRFCIDAVDQVKMLKFICFVKNYYNCSIDISGLCGEMRIANNLKFQFFNRVLTVGQLEFLKYESRDRFLTILLRYNMHFIADTIFGDSDSKYRIFLHWSKCKIQKNSQTIAFEEIKQKYENIQKKIKNTKIFTDIAKYCLDRGKDSLAQNFIQLDTNPDRKIMVYLLMLASNKQKRIVQKLLNSAEQSSRSFLIYRVIQQLIEQKYVKNNVWVNILYEKPNVSRHYINYLKYNKKQELLKNYYIQNKNLENLGYYALEVMFYNSMQQQSISNLKYNQTSFNLFIQKIQEYKQFLPILHSSIKSHNKNIQMQLLRKVKQNQYIPTLEEIKQIKNDIILEYLSQLLFIKNKNDLAIISISQIKSDKIYTILLRKQKFRQALQIAFNRKNKQAIMEINQRVPPEMQAEIQERLKKLNKK